MSGPMRRALVFTGLGLMAAVIVAVTTTGLWWKHPLGQPDVIAELIEELDGHVMAERWPEAAAAARRLADEWEQAALRVAVGTERRARQELGLGIAQLEAMLKAQDRTEALMEVATLRYWWRELGT